MIIELFVWLNITLLYLLLFRHQKNITESKQINNNKFNDLSSIKYKSIDEQKQFVTIKSDSGTDLMSIAIGWFIFIIPTLFFIFPLIDNLYISLIAITLSAILFAYLSSRIFYSANAELIAIKNFINNMFIGLAFIFIKFFDVPQGLWFVAIIIVSLLVISWGLDKYVK